MDPVEYVQVEETPWASGIVAFPIVRLSEWEAAPEPSEELFARINRVLIAAADFLDRRDPAVFERMRLAGLSVHVFLDIRMDQDQFSFELPPEFVRSCGRHGLGIFLMSNDISAEEAIRRGAT